MMVMFIIRSLMVVKAILTTITYKNVTQIQIMAVSYLFFNEKLTKEVLKKQDEETLLVNKEVSGKNEGKMCKKTGSVFI